MIAANYTMHLYCDCHQCQASFRQEQAEYMGESWTQVAKQARRAGWRISADRTRCFAPGHAVTRRDSE